MQMLKIGCCAILLSLDFYEVFASSLDTVTLLFTKMFIILKWFFIPQL